MSLALSSMIEHGPRTLTRDVRARRSSAAARCLAALLLLTTVAAAQGNEENWHPLGNGFDGVYAGQGLGGGLVTSADGIGTWIPGTDLRGSTIADFSGTFGYKLVSWSQMVCIGNAAGTGTGSIKPSWTFWELDGLNANTPAIFTNPSISAPGLVATTTGAPYGTPPSGSASFLSLPMPSFLGTATFVIPNNGLLPSSDGGTADLIAAIGFLASVTLPTGCMNVEFGFVPTTVASNDFIDGWWHWAQAGPVYGTTRSYFGFSFDEINIWQSNTVQTTGAGAALLTFPCVTDYAFHIASIEANTTTALAPNGAELGTNTYTDQTENTNPGIGGYPLIDLNGGYDVGRGARALSASGTAGFADANDVAAGPPVFAPQDPAGGSGGGGGEVPTLGFHTWDTRTYFRAATGPGAPGPADGGGGTSPVQGSERVTWVSVDWDAFAGKQPEATVYPTAFFGTVRQHPPVYANETGSYPQQITVDLLPVFTHTTGEAPSGFPDPAGDEPGRDEPHAAGASIHVPIAGITIGLTIPIQYGTSGYVTGLGLVWDPNIASVSGSKRLFIVD